MTVTMCLELGSDSIRHQKTKSHKPLASCPVHAGDRFEKGTRFRALHLRKLHLVTSMLVSHKKKTMEIAGGEKNCGAR